jgi:hypothetical protein
MSTASSPEPTGGTAVAGSTPAPQSTMSLLPATHTPRATPAAPAAAPAAGGDPAAPAAPETPRSYEHPWLQEEQGGKYFTLDEYRKGSSEKLKELHKAQQQIKLMEQKSPLLKGPPIDPETGQPAPYTFTPSEANAKLGRQIDPEDPVLQGVTGWGHKWSVPQEAMQELFSGVYEGILDTEAQADEDIAKEVAAAGFRELVEHYGSAEAANEAANGVLGWFEGLIGEENRDLVRAAVGLNPKAVKALDLAMKALDSVNLPAGGGGGAAQGDTHASILAMRSEDPNWRQNPQKVARYEKFLSDQATRNTAAGQPAGSPLDEARRAQGR